MPRAFRVAAAQYPLDRLRSLDELEAKLRSWIARAADAGAELLVFPEYGAFDLADIDGRAHDALASLDSIARRLAEIDAIHARLATEYRIALLAGSAPERRSDGRLVNVARLFAPGGARGRYEKWMPTPGEREQWHITGGRELQVFDLGRTKVGIAICYDIEFPLIARALAEAGAEIVLAPSDTETEWGYWRVRTGAAARALENQFYVVHAPLIGAYPWCAAGPAHRGAAAVYAPSDLGFPAGGIVASGEMDRPQWVHATLDLDLLAEVRERGSVQIFRHWPEQPGAAALPPARIIDLSGPLALAAE
jgi:predicted amidohydrolase